MSTNEASVAWRNGKPDRRLAPWSAVMTISASSYTPASRSCDTNAPTTLVTVFLTWGLVVAVVGALLAGMMNQLTRSLWTAFLVWWNA